jgi:hypothetical protein
VGEIRRQLAEGGGPGDHPLFAGMANDELIYAGVSESLTDVTIYTGDEVDVNQPWVTQFQTPGVHRVNILLQLEDGSIVTKPMMFVIVDDSDVTLRDTLNRVVPETTATYKTTLDYSVDTSTLDIRTYTGELKVNDLLVGFFKTTKTTDGVMDTEYQPFSGPGTPIPVKSGDKVTLSLQEPFEFTLNTVVSIPDKKPYFDNSIAPSTWLETLRTHPYFADHVPDDQILTDIRSYTGKAFQESLAIGESIQGLWWKELGKGRTAFTNSVYLPAKMKIYTNITDWNTNKPQADIIGAAVIIANTNDVYYWDDLPMTWVKHTSKAPTLFSLNRDVVNLRDNTNWVIQTNSTIPR